MLVEIQKQVPRQDYECKRFIGEKDEGGTGGQKSHETTAQLSPVKKKRKKEGWIGRVSEHSAMLRKVWPASRKSSSRSYLSGLSGIELLWYLC